MLKRPSVWGGVAGIFGVPALLTGISILANVSETDHRLGWALVIVGAMLIMLGASIFVWLSGNERPAEPVTIKAEPHADHQSTAVAAGRDINIVYGQAAAQPQSTGDHEVNDAIQELEKRWYQIADNNINGRQLFEQAGHKLLRGRSTFYFGQDVAQVFNVESRSVPEQAILDDLVLIGLAQTEYVYPPQPTGPESGVTRPEPPHYRYELSPLGRRVLSRIRKDDGSLECMPGVVIDDDYGPRHEVAAYVNLKVVNRGDALVNNARGRLMSVEPSSDQAVIATIPSLRFPPGLLQWSARYGGGEVASFASECDLDVLAFENNDQIGVLVYANERIRGKHELILDAAESWNIAIEVFAESGHKAICRFRIKRGKERVFAHASPRGTLYEPDLEVVSSP
jgi:hypothetical protein